MKLKTNLSLPEGVVMTIVRPLKKGAKEYGVPYLCYLKDGELLDFPENTPSNYCFKEDDIVYWGEGKQYE